MRPVLFFGERKFRLRSASFPLIPLFFLPLTEWFLGNDLYSGDHSHNGFSNGRARFSAYFFSASTAPGETGWGRS